MQFFLRCWWWFDGDTGGGRASYDFDTFRPLAVSEMLVFDDKRILESRLVARVMHR
jgi:hypothetical protein